MTPADIQLPRWRCTVAYDGTGFDGWQSQPGGQAVQDTVERRLADIFGRAVRVHGSGRTDAGVHARGQVFHFDADWRHGAPKLLAALRGGLPPTVQVTAVRRVKGDFHARFSADGKIYRYEIMCGAAASPFDFRYCWAVPRALDVAVMRAAATVLRGQHDFRAFCAENGAESGNTVRVLRRLEVAARGRRISITAEADGFLYKMVRSLVGALVAAGQGRLPPAEIATLLRAERRTHRVETAPPQGLFLVKVLYGGGNMQTKRGAATAHGVGGERRSRRNENSESNEGVPEPAAPLYPDDPDLNTTSRRADSVTRASGKPPSTSRQRAREPVP